MDTYQQAQAKLATRGATTTVVNPRRTPRPYLLRGLLHCGLCQRRMQASQINDHATGPDPNREIIDECDRKIANYRALLDAGTEAKLVAGWIAETSAERAAAETRSSARRRTTHPKLSKDQIRDLITAIGDLRTALRRANTHPAKAALYQHTTAPTPHLPPHNTKRPGRGRPRPGRCRHRVSVEGQTATVRTPRDLDDLDRTRRAVGPLVPVATSGPTVTM